MSQSVGPDRQDEVIGGLTELYEQAEGDDRRRAALLLGLAIADKAALLPDHDPGHGQLAEQGSALLDESGEDSPAVARGRESLARSRQLSQGPDSFQLQGPDLNWDMNWDQVRGLNDAARNLTAMLPGLAAAFPPGSPLGKALTDIAGVVGAFDRGEWTRESDAVLKSAIAQVEQAGLGSGIGTMLRLVSMFVRIQRGRLAQEQGREPDWPPLAEIDALIAEFETTDLGEQLGWGPFESAQGLPHLMIGFLIGVRLFVDTRNPDTRRDAAWREDTLRLLDRADKHLSQAPPMHAGPVSQIRANLAKPRAALLQWNPSATAAAPAPRPAASQPDPAPPPEPAPEPSLGDIVNDALEGIVLNDPQSPLSAGAGLFSGITTPSGMEAIRLLAQAGDNAVLQAATHLMPLYQASVAGRWTEEAARELAQLELKNEQLSSQPDASLADRAKLAGMLAQAHVVRWNLLSHSPRPADRPTARDTAALAAEAEAVLDLTAAAAEQPYPPDLGLLPGLIHYLASTLRTDLGRPGSDEPDAEQLRLAREHMAQVPAAAPLTNSPRSWATSTCSRNCSPTSGAPPVRNPSGWRTDSAKSSKPAALCWPPPKPQSAKRGKTRPRKPSAGH